MDLSQFEAFEIQPCVLLNEQGQPIHVSYEPCEPGDPDLAEYVLYGRTPGQGVMALADFASEELAEMFRDMLIAWRKAALVDGIARGETIESGYAPKMADGKLYLECWDTDPASVKARVSEAGLWGPPYKLVPVIVITADDSAAIDPPVETEWMEDNHVAD